MAKHPVKALPYANDALKGIGAKTIEIHHDKLYAGYVNKRNEIEEELTKVDRSKANQIYSQLRGLKHEETFAANGQILHENDKVTPDLSLEQIKLKSAVLTYKGHRFGVAF